MVNVIGYVIVVIIAFYTTVAASAWMLANSTEELILVRKRCLMVPIIYVAVFFKVLFMSQNRIKCLVFMLHLQRAILFILYTGEELFENAEKAKKELQSTPRKERTATYRNKRPTNVAAVSYSKLRKAIA
jgi:hypothetical protein